MRFLLPLLAIVSACAPDRDEEVWRFAIEENRGSVQDRYATRFAELVDERTGGQVEVKVYPYGTLGTSDHITELLHNGTLQFAMASPGHLGKLIPEVQALLLHFVLSDEEEVNRQALKDPELMAVFDELYGEKGFELLAVYSEGWMVWTTQEPVRTPEDFSGVKMRVMTSPLLLAAYDAYGASPTPLPYSEVYSALQLSMIDGQVNPVFAIQEMSFHEVTNAMIFPNHSPFVTTAAANQDFYEELEPGRRAMVDDIVEQLQVEIDEVQQAYNAERLEKIRAKRPQMQFITLSSSEREAFRVKSLPVREQFLQLAPARGAEVLEALEGAVRRAEAQR